MTQEQVLELFTADGEEDKAIDKSTGVGGGGKEEDLAILRSYFCVCVFFPLVCPPFW